MTKVEQTPEKLKAGINIPAEKLTTLQLVSPLIEILIGGPYKGQNGMVTYGHMAIRVSNGKDERIYDFGRYGNYTGPFGDGILRVWTNFSSYIAAENVYGRSTTGFSYEINAQQAEKIFSHYAKKTASLRERVAKYANLKEYKLPNDYDGVNNNCVTMSFSGARIALPGIESNVDAYNKGRGLTEAEKQAVRVSNLGWPSHLFMPEDVKDMLEQEKKYIPKKIKIYGPKK